MVDSGNVRRGANGRMCLNGKINVALGGDGDGGVGVRGGDACIR